MFTGNVQMDTATVKQLPIGQQPLLGESFRASWVFLIPANDSYSRAGPLNALALVQFFKRHQWPTGHLKSLKQHFISAHVRIHSDPAFHVVVICS